jgi:hypothetical protein
MNKFIQPSLLKLVATLKKVNVWWAIGFQRKYFGALVENSKQVQQNGL